MSIINELRGVAYQFLAENRSPVTCITKATSGGAGDSGGDAAERREEWEVTAEYTEVAEREEILENGVLGHEHYQELVMHKFSLRELRVLRGDLPRWCFGFVSESGTT
jgi:hypothetical protein